MRSTITTADVQKINDAFEHPINYAINVNTHSSISLNYVIGKIHGDLVCCFINHITYFINIPIVVARLHCIFTHARCEQLSALCANIFKFNVCL